MTDFGIDTSRLRLFPVTENDREMVRSRIFAHPDVVKTLMGDASDTEKQKALVDAWYDEYAYTWDKLGFGLWGIFGIGGSFGDLPPGLLGIIWLEDTGNKDRRQLDIGYALTPHAWRRGIVSEAANAVLDHAFRFVGADAVDALIYGAVNPASTRIIEKLGGCFIGQKPFLHYGDQEWFEATHDFDLWMIDTALPDMVESRVEVAVHRTGLFAGDGLLDKTKAMGTLFDRARRNPSLTLSKHQEKALKHAFEKGVKSPGWSHYRVARMDAKALM